MRKFYLSVLVFLLLTVNLQAQRPVAKFERINTEHGLSQNTVRTIFQDSRGFLWFGTQDGLNKYDGYTFKHYRHDPDDPYSISENFITAICEDRSGAIWIGTQTKGLNKFDRNTEQFTHYRHDPDNPNSLSHDYISVIYQDRAGNLWIGTNQSGINKLIRKEETEQNEKEKFIHYLPDPGNPGIFSLNITSIFEDGSGNLWIGAADGLYKMKISEDEETGGEDVQFIRYKHDPEDPGSLGYNNITLIFEDRSGTMWVGTGNGLNRMIKNDSENLKFIRYNHDPDDPNSISNDLISSIFEDRDGVLWMGTHRGLNKMVVNRDKSTGKIAERFIQFKNDPDDPLSLSEDRIFSIYEDRSGVLWIGTEMGGLNKFTSRSEKFEKYVIPSEYPNSLINTIVRNLYEDESGVLWIGTEGGLNRINRETGEHVHYLPSPYDPVNRQQNNVYSVYGDPDDPDLLWIGTIYEGLNKINIKKFNGFFTPDKSQTRYILRPNFPSPHKFAGCGSLFKDRSGVLWIGSNCGLFKLVPGAVERAQPAFEQNPIDKERWYAMYNVVQVIYEDRGGELWIGTGGSGLCRFDRETGTFTQYINDPDDLTSIGHDRVNGIYEDRAGNFWISTYGGGLNLFDRKSETFKQYRVKDGLPNDVVYGVLEDENGNLWFGTNWGLSKFDPRTEKFINFTYKDGLQNNEFNWGAHFKSKSGEMFFGGIGGFNAFYPENIKDNEIVPEIVITGFQIYNRTVPIGEMDDGRVILDKPISETEEINLSHRDNVISFEFAALHYVNPGANRYAYRMEGLEEEWNEVGSRRFASYSHLAPGEYTFRAKACNSDGVWNEEGTTVRIIITPPFWATAWFKILAALILAGLVFGGYEARLKNQKIQRKKLEKLIGERTEELSRTNIHLKKEITDREKAEGELQKAHDKLEIRVDDRTKELSTANKELKSEISQREKAEKERLEAVEMSAKTSRLASIGVMAGGITHEINQPLTAIKFNVDGVLYWDKRNKGILPEMVIDKFQEISDGINRIDEIIKHMRSYWIAPSRIEDENFDLNDAVKGALSLINRQLHSHEIVQEIILDENALMLKGTKVNVEQIVINLVLNAMRILDEKQKNDKMIRIITKKEKGRIILRVEDNGAGIPKDKMDKLFDPFFSTREPGKGMGLGLAIVKRFVDEHEAVISAENNNDGGATFKVEFKTGD
ncbi:two-component regulator propeller domain-containing protein [candidate division KSB1 bacterium]